MSIWQLVSEDEFIRVYSLNDQGKFTRIEAIWHKHFGYYNFVLYLKSNMFISYNNQLNENKLPYLRFEYQDDNININGNLCKEQNIHKYFFARYNENSRSEHINQEFKEYLTKPLTIEEVHIFFRKIYGFLKDMNIIKSD